MSCNVSCGCSRIEESSEQTVRLETLDRRQFVKLVSLGAAYSVCGGANVVETLLADATPSLQGAGILRLNLADFPALQNANGSVRVAFNPFTINGPSGPFYPVLVNRGANNQFFALNSRCTHQFCVVPPFSQAANASVCSCHGSRFRIDGTVVLGPAFAPLARYNITFDANTNQLCIEIPGLGYSVSIARVANPNDRLQLRFSTLQNVTYEVERRSAVDNKPSAAVPFATSPSGTLNLTSLTGNGSTATIYVARLEDQGFYLVRVKIAIG